MVLVIGDGWLDLAGWLLFLVGVLLVGSWILRAQRAMLKAASKEELDTIYREVAPLTTVALAGSGLVFVGVVIISGFDRLGFAFLAGTGMALLTVLGAAWRIRLFKWEIPRLLRRDLE